jgi:hypothetical protein
MYSPMWLLREPTDGDGDGEGEVIEMVERKKEQT